ncbi:MAG: flavodoxin family protein [Gammaproteobacteria bacterium]
MKSLLIVCHCPSPNVATLCEAVASGAREGAPAAVTVTVRSPFETRAEHVQASDGLILGTTENFGYMNGALKDFFERIYYPCLEPTQGRPYALFVKGGQDGAGAKQSVERIVAGLRWRAVQPPLIMTGAYDTAWLASCRELGMTMTAGLDAGLF